MAATLTPCFKWSCSAFIIICLAFGIPALEHNMCSPNAGLDIQLLNITIPNTFTEPKCCACIVTGNQLNVTFESTEREVLLNLDNDSTEFMDWYGIKFKQAQHSLAVTWDSGQVRNQTKWTLRFEDSDGSNLDSYLCSEAIFALISPGQTRNIAPGVSSTAEREGDSVNPLLLKILLPVAGVVVGVMLTVGAVLLIRRSGRLVTVRARETEVSNVERIHSAFNNMYIDSNSYPSSSTTRSEEALDKYDGNAREITNPFASVRSNHRAKNPSMPMEFPNLSLFKTSEPTPPDQDHPVIHNAILF